MLPTIGAQELICLHTLTIDLSFKGLFFTKTQA